MTFIETHEDKLECLHELAEKVIKHAKKLKEHLDDLKHDAKDEDDYYMERYDKRKKKHDHDDDDYYRY